MFFRSLRRTFLAAWLRLFAGGRSVFCASYEVIDPRRGLLLPGLLLAGHRLLLALAGTRVGLRPLPVHREPAAVANPLVAADLDLAPDVGLDLAAQVTFDLVGRVDPVAELHQLFVAEAVDPGVAADAGCLQRLQRPRAADAIDIGERDLDPLIAGQVHSRKPGHVRAVLLRLAEVLRAAPMPCPDMAPASVRGSQPEVAACGTRLSLRQPCRCLCLGSVQMTMTRPCRRMIRHLLQIFLTLGLTFTVPSPLNLFLL